MREQATTHRRLAARALRHARATVRVLPSDNGARWPENRGLGQTRQVVQTHEVEDVVRGACELLKARFPPEAA